MNPISQRDFITQPRVAVPRYPGLATPAPPLFLPQRGCVSLSDYVTVGLVPQLYFGTHLYAIGLVPARSKIAFWNALVREIVFRTLATQPVPYPLPRMVWSGRRGGGKDEGKGRGIYTAATGRGNTISRASALRNPIS